MIKPITISFKGDRNYAQIADIFTAVVDCSGAAQGHDLLFTVHAPLLTPFAQVEVIDPSAHPESGYAARLNFLAKDGTRQQAVVRPSPQEGDIPRRPFDENALRAQIHLDGPVAQYAGDIQTDFAELVTSMNKKLLQSVFPQENAKWWAARLKVDMMYMEWEKVTLTCLTTKPARLYNSAISVNGKPAGEISFVSRPA
jgi:hypothetical protein